MISSQRCSSCATRIQFSRLAEFKSGQNVTVLLKSAVEGTLPAGRLPCCKANAYKQTHFKTGYLGACASPYKRCWNGILKSDLDQRPLKDWGRCAVRGIPPLLPCPTHSLTPHPCQVLSTSHTGINLAPMNLAWRRSIDTCSPLGTD